MPILSYILRNVLSGTSDCCFLCFNTISDIETAYNSEDKVSLGFEVETTEVLYEIINTVLGDKVLDGISTNSMICQNCTRTVINCYKFIQQCRRNIEQLHHTIDSLQTSVQNIGAGNNDYKSLFVALDTSNYNVALYYDKDQNILNQTQICQRFQEIYEDGQFYIDIEPKYSPDHENEKRSEQSSTLDVIKLADIIDNDDLNNLKCKTCLKYYPTVTKMKQHYLRQHAPKDFKCPQCPRSYGSLILVNQHIKYSHTKAVCSQCGKTYQNIYSLKHHEEGHSRRLVCQTCGKVYKGKISFNNHIKNKLCDKMRKSNAEATLVCDYCGKKYAQKAALRLHINMEHEDGKGLICDWCGKKLSTISRLKDHIITHTKQKDYECEQCGGRFVTKTSLLYHTRTHTGEKPYPCNLCDKKFLSASRRTEHVKRHHTENRVECDICHARFKGRSGLVRHRRKHFNARSKLYTHPPDSDSVS